MTGFLTRLAVPIGVVAIIMLLVVPVPPLLLDTLIILNIMFALVILLTTMFIKKPLDFSVFPSLLLVATLFRLGLNVASTRLVLGEAYAGQVIEAFGHIAVGGSLIIGAVVFLILVVIQFVVVTKGAERVAEVGARFTLDAMPGKQMAIDADLNAGLITDVQARERRAEVAAEADFYGAMDGASKFVKGDAIAGLVIIIINIVGGIAIGLVQHGMTLEESVSTYSLLTIGDGLVTQIPALLMAVSTGMIVTRSNAETEMGREAFGQLAQSVHALTIAGCAAGVMAFIPGMPMLPFLVVGAMLVLVAQRMRVRAEDGAAEPDAPAPAASETTEELMEKMRVHALEILLASDTVDLVTGGPDDLLARVKALRRRIALDLGLVVPPVRTRDSVELPAATYVIRIAGVEAGRGTAPRPRAGRRTRRRFSVTRTLTRWRTWVWVLPAVVLLLVFVYYPIVENFRLSLFSWNAFSAHPVYVGLDNYRTAVDDPVFWRALRNNTVFAVTSLVFQVGFSLVLAALLEEFVHQRLRGILRTIYFIPAVISITVAGILFSFIYNPQIGLLNRFLGAVGLESWQHSWLGEPGTAPDGALFVDWIHRLRLPKVSPQLP